MKLKLILNSRKALQTTQIKQSLCQLAFNAITVLSVIGCWQPSHFEANNFSKSGLQYGFPSRSKNGTADIGFLHGPAQLKYQKQNLITKLNGNYYRNNRTP